MSLIYSCDVSSCKALSVERVRKVLFKKCKRSESLRGLRGKCVRLNTFMGRLIYLEGITPFERLEIKGRGCLLARFRVFCVLELLPGRSIPSIVFAIIDDCANTKLQGVPSSDVLVDNCFKL